MRVKVIGIDCATNPKKTGISLGQYDNKYMALLEAKIPVKGKSMYKYLYNYIIGEDGVSIGK